MSGAVCFFLIFLFSCVEGQLEFTTDQRGRDVTINCTLPDISTTNVVIVIGMSVVRLTNSGDELLASVTSVGSVPISHSGIVTSSISLDGSHESFVSIEWLPANKSLEGDYVCRLNGLDNTNSPVLLTQKVTLKLQAMGPGVVATPEILEIGLTRFLSVKCYIFDLASRNISEVTSISLSFVHDGIEQLLITLNIVDGTDISTGSDVASSDGYLGPKQDQENFLEATWKKPGLNRTGRYECSFEGLDLKGDPVRFESTYELNHVEPSKEALIQTLDELQDKLESLSTENQELESDRENLALNLRILEQSVKGHKICDTVDLPVGQYPITLYPDDGQGLLEVLCDVVSPGDVWTVFQKRYNGSESFSRDFAAYDRGFGSVRHEHWLGFKQMKRIMGTGLYQIRIDLADYQGVNYARIYPQFDVGAFDGYKLTVNGYNDGGLGLSFSSGADFSTLDHGPQSHCAIEDNGGWWYDNCAFSNLNGKWGQPGEAGVSWFELPGGRQHPLTKTEMKFKKRSQP